MPSLSSWGMGLSRKTVLRSNRIQVSGRRSNALARVPAVSGKTVLEGTFRTYSEDAFAACRAALADIGQAVEARTGCGVEVHCSEGYPPVMNDAPLYDAVCAAMGGAVKKLPEPVLGADDFSFYQRRAPGLYFFLGVGQTPALHAPDFTFDDELVLPKGLAFWQRLVALA